MRKFDFSQYVQSVYLTHYLGGNLANILEVAMNFDPNFHNEKIKEYKYCLDGEIRFAIYEEPTLLPETCVGLDEIPF